MRMARIASFHPPPPPSGRLHWLRNRNRLGRSSSCSTSTFTFHRSLPGSSSMLLLATVGEWRSAALSTAEFALHCMGAPYVWVRLLHLIHTVAHGNFMVCTCLSLCVCSVFPQRLLPTLAYIDVCVYLSIWYLASL